LNLMVGWATVNSRVVGRVLFHASGSLVVYLLLLQGFNAAYAQDQDGTEANILREGDYAVYVGFFPRFVTSSGFSVFGVPLDVRERISLKAGPWVVEWFVVEDLGRYNIVWVHLFYRLTNKYLPQDRVFVMDGPEKPVGSGTPLIEAPRPGVLGQEGQGEAAVKDVDASFLVVVDESEMAVVDRELEMLARWVYTLSPDIYRLISNASTDGGGLVEPGLSPFIRVGNQASSLELRTFVGLDEGSYVLLVPRGGVYGPFVIAEVYYGVRVADLREGTLSLPKALREVLVAHVTSNGLFSLEHLNQNEVVPVFSGVYDVSSSIALVYDSFIEPLVCVHSGCDIGETIIPESGLGNAIESSLADELDSLESSLGEDASIYSIGLMYLVDARARGLELNVLGELPMDPGLREFVEFGLERSLLIAGYKPSPENIAGLEFVGEWDWDSARGLAAAGRSKQVQEAPGTGSEPPGSGLGFTIVMASIGVLAVIAGLLLVTRRGR